ncbi:DEAD/DEAH box helicase [Rothia sp. P5764]|uniref:DEAD/DEAH box helicase n=1 Tax=Rothia sp. P5764 TaxID=3402654 RepID=UPI003AC7A379
MFEELRKISFYLGTDKEAEGRDQLIKFINKNYKNCQQAEIIIDLIVAYGLHPYLKLFNNLNELASATSAIDFELHSNENFTFHPHQKYIFDKLYRGENVILSAPTSYGKTSIIVELIKKSLWDNIVLIFPTLALVDENRRKINSLNRDQALGYQILTQVSQEAGERNIYIMTAERFLSTPMTVDVDFFLIDEFYKLGSFHDSRRATLNVAWHKLKNSGAQYCLLGPFIDDLSPAIANTIKETFISTDISTVATEYIDRSNHSDRYKELKKILEETYDESTIIYTKSPKACLDLSNKIIIDSTEIESSSKAYLFADWVERNYIKDWSYPNSLKHGIALHSGPLPRSFQRLSMKFFNENHVKILICTSTIIEGANTTAKNIVIFDNLVATRKIDYFTYRNICGRSGRMGKHLVGRVYNLASSPRSAPTTIDIPIETQTPQITAQEIIQIDPSQINKRHIEVYNNIKNSDILPISFTQKYPHWNPEILIETADKIIKLSRKDREKLLWKSLPDSESASYTILFILANLLQVNAGRANREIAILKNILYSDSFSSSVQKQIKYTAAKDKETAIKDLISFKRNNLEYLIPSALLMLNEVLKFLYGEESSNYQLFISQIENARGFHLCKSLEEIGLPSPLTEKLHDLGILLESDSFETACRKLKNIDLIENIDSILEEIEVFILKDVIDGI